MGWAVRRLFRFYEKKRGGRRTGSQVAGRLGETLFFGVLFLLGAASLTALITSQVLDPDPRLYTFGYGFYLMLIVLSSFVLIGGGGLTYTVLQVGASAERLSMLKRKATEIGLIRDARTSPRDLPTIPSEANLTNSPGIRLAFRLPCMQSPVWRMLAMTSFCLLWSGVAGVLLVVAVNSHRAGRPQWLLSLFILPFLCGGLWAVHYFFRELLIHTMIGPTSVEISSHPLFPGRGYELFVTQGGRLQVERLEIWLVCVEEATFRQGTDIRSERQVVHKRRLACREHFRIEPSRPFEHVCQFEIPEEAMHSFHTRNNAVHWRIVVRGFAEAWPPFDRAFPVIVHPAGIRDQGSGVRGQESGVRGQSSSSDR